MAATMAAELRGMFNVGAAGYPRLAGKAAEIRHLGRILSETWDSSMDPEYDFHRSVSIAMHANSAHRQLYLGKQQLAAAAAM